MSKILDLNRVANGAFHERFNYELQKLLQNVADPNTDAEKKRKMQVTLTLEPDENREVAKITIDVKSTPVPRKSIGSTLLIDQDELGRATGAELKSGAKGQTYLDYDTGEILDDRGQNVVDLKKTKQGGVK